MRVTFLLSGLLLVTLSCGGSTTGDSAAGSGGNPGGTGGAGGAVAGGAGGASAGAPVDDGRPKLPCDVERMLKTECGDCHGATPQYGAPMPLVTYDDLKKKSLSDPSRQVYQLADERIHSATKPMPPPPRSRLSFDSSQVFENWLETGLPTRAAGEACQDPKPTPAPPTPTCEPTFKLKSSSPWEMPKTTADEYVCYGVELPGEATKRHITGIVPLVDNKTIVHHLLLFQMDKAEDATPHKCDAIFPINGKAIYAWAPGAPSYLLPEAAGFAVDAAKSTHLMVQVHYSNLTQLEGQKDSTELGLCLTDQVRPYDADIMWVGGYDFKLPPHQKTSVECTLSFGEALTFLPVHVFQAWPHMHRLGTRLETQLLRPDVDPIGLGLADPYTFADQAVYPMNVDIYPGDKLATRCTWDNSTDSTVKWGEATSEEMCFNLLAYYPKIDLPQYGSPAAAALSPCKKIANP